MGFGVMGAGGNSGRGKPFCVRKPPARQASARAERVSPFQGAGFLRCPACGRAWPLDRPTCACGVDRLPVLLPGTRLPGDWEIVEELCAGRHEDRYQVRRDRQDAIALVVRDPFLADDARDRGARLAALGHPGLGRVLDQEPAWGRLVRVDELPPATTVRDLVADGRLDVAAVGSLATGLARLLGILHGAEIAHGCLDVDAVRVVRRDGGLAPVLAPVPAAAPSAVPGDDLVGAGDVLAGLLRAARRSPAAELQPYSALVELLRTGAVADALDLERRLLALAR